MKVHTKIKKQPQCFIEEGVNKSWCFCSVDKAAVKRARKEDGVETIKH